MKDDLRDPAFRYVGRWPCGRHAFRADLSGLSSKRAFEFEQRIADWHLNMAEGPNAVARPVQPEGMQIKHAAVVCLIERAADVVRFDQTFRVEGLSPDDLAPVA